MITLNLNTDINFENILINWDNLEIKVEDKLNSLRDYVLKKVGLEESVEYYQTKGKFLHRYAAGFITRYFDLMKDASFILLNPMHIVDIITAFVKNLFHHPIQVAKQIWACWCWFYKNMNAYVLGKVSAAALLSALIIALSTYMTTGQVSSAIRSATTTMSEGVVGNFTSLPKRLMGIGKSLGETIRNTDDLFRIIRTSPHKILEKARLFAKSEVGSYGGVRTYKYYTSPFRKRDTI
jgi:hypothetical protein